MMTTDVLQASEIAPRTRSQSEVEEHDVATAKKEVTVIEIDSDDEKERVLLVRISAAVYVGMRH